jgi:hypothetical protein
LFELRDLLQAADRQLRESLEQIGLASVKPEMPLARIGRHPGYLTAAEPYANGDLRFERLLEQMAVKLPEFR